MLTYLVRHGETKLCKRKYIKGWKDSDLTENGIKSGEKLAGLLKNKGIEIIYASNLGRCVQTARIINKKLNLKIIKSDKLRERNFGFLNGKSQEEVERVLDINDFEAIAPGGESFKQAQERALEFIESLKNKKEKTVLIVTHAGILDNLLAYSTSDEKVYSIIF